MARSTRVLLFAAVTSLLVLAGLVHKSALATSRERWVNYHPALAKKYWEENAFQPIAQRDDLKRSIAESITRSARAQEPSAPQEIVTGLAEMAYSLLLAYSADSFEDFWSFRTPTGVVAEFPDKVAYLRSLLSAATSDMGPEYRVAESDTIKELMQTNWKLGIEKRARAPYPGGSKSIFFQGACTDCLQDVAPASAAVVSLDTTRPPDLGAIMDDRANAGIALYTGAFEALDRRTSGAEAKYSCISFVVRLKNGVVHPVYISMARRGDARFVPLALGVPLSGGKRALFLF